MIPSYFRIEISVHTLCSKGLNDLHFFLKVCIARTICDYYGLVYVHVKLTNSEGLVCI